MVCDGGNVRRAAGGDRLMAGSGNSRWPAWLMAKERETKREREGRGCHTPNPRLVCDIPPVVKQLRRLRLSPTSSNHQKSKCANGNHKTSKQIILGRIGKYTFLFLNTNLFHHIYNIINLSLPVYTLLRLPKPKRSR